MKKLLIVGATALLVAGTVQAAVVVTWQSTGPLSNGVSSISTTGTLAYAYNTGSPNAYTVNGITFTGTAAGPVTNLNNQGNVIFNPVDSGGTVSTFNNLTGDFGSLLDSAQWGTVNANNTITLSNLVSGKQYLVQVFSSDNRPGRDNILQMDQGTPRQFNSISTGATNSGAYVMGTFTADSSGAAAFTFRYVATTGNANINAIQVREIASATNTTTNVFVHPGIGLTVADLDAIKANLTVEPWKTGYNDLLAKSQSSLSYVMQGPFTEVSRTLNDNAWESDMTAVHNMARLWYFTGNGAYAQKARDILISWANTHTNWLPGETYLTMGYNAFRVFEGADILRGTWPGWTTNDTATCKAYFENVWWDQYHIAVPAPLRSANQGMAQFTPALGVAVFNDDQEKFDQCLQVFRSDAPGALRSSLPNGQIGDTGRDAHDQGQLMLMAWAAEVFWDQGIDVYAEYDNRLLAAAEYISRLNLLAYTPFIQAGTVYDIYPIIHYFQSDGLGGHYEFEVKMINALYSAYVVNKGLRSPYLEQYLSYATQTSDAFCYLKPYDTSTATPLAPLPGPAGVASVTSLSSVNMGDCTTGSASYNAGTKTWTVTGRGTQMWYDSVPDYRFAYLPVTGDATIIAKLTSLSGGSTQDARAGLVFSGDLTDSTNMQAIVITHPSGTAPQMYAFRRGDVARSHNGNTGARSYPRMPDPKIPYWLKIERIGNRVNSYSSPDGISWSCGESADYVLGSTAYFGLAVSSDEFGTTATATFTDVRITGGDGGEARKVPAAPFAIYASPGGDQVPLRWLESFEADGYKIWRSTKPGGPYTLLTQTSGTSFVDTNVLFGTHYYYKVSATNAMGESPLSPEEQLWFPDTDYYQAEAYNAQSGLGTEATRDFFGGRNLSSIHGGDWSRYDGITLRTGAVFRARVACYNTDHGKIEVRTGSTTGPLIGVIDPAYTGGTQLWGTMETNLTVTPGVYNLFLVFTPATSNSASGLNLNWFDIVYPYINEFDLGMDVTLAYNPATNALVNRGFITAWDSTATHLKLADGSDLSNLDFAALGITSWKTTDFGDAAKTTVWNGAKLSGLTLITDGNFGAGDNFKGANFSGVIWGAPTSTADPARFFSGGSGATSAATREDAITFAGANLSLITGSARATMINNLGGFDGGTPIGAKFDNAFLTNSGWNKADLLAAGWQYESRLLVNTATYAAGAAPTFSTTDLAQTQYLSSSFTGGQQGSEHATLFNGLIGNEDGDTDDSGEVRLDSGNTITVTFNTSVNTNGYDLTGISTLFGWNPASNGRANQGYEIILTYINNSTATLAGPAHWEPNSPANYYTKVSFVDEDGGVLESDTIVHNGTPSAGPRVRASRVKAVTFNITHDANAGGWVLAREFDIVGVPTLPPEAYVATILPGASVSNGNFSAQFSGIVGAGYQVEWKPDLTDAMQWMMLTNISSLPASPFTFSAPATNSAAYFRVRWIPN